jgi:hypothetical protein
MLYKGWICCFASFQRDKASNFCKLEHRKHDLDLESWKHTTKYSNLTSKISEDKPLQIFVISTLVKNGRLPLSLSRVQYSDPLSVLQVYCFTT